MVWVALLLAAIAPHEYPEQDWWPGLVRSVEGTDSYEEYLEQRGVELQDNGFLPLTANAVDNKLYYFAHPEWEPSCGDDLSGPLLPSGWSRIVQAEPEPPERIRIEAEVLKDMAEKTFTNPTDEAWDVNLAWEDTEVDGSGDLAVVSEESEGWRASNGWDPELGDVVDSSLVEWTATGDAGGEVAVSDTDPTSLEGDGVDDFVNLNPPDLTDVTSLTYEAWFKPKSFPNHNPVLQFGTLGSTFAFDNFMTVRSDGEFVGTVRNNDDTRPWVSSGAGFVTLDQWQHGAVVWDGSTVKVYLDGVEVASESLSGTVTAANDFYILRLAQNYADMYVSDVRVWNVARTQTEIQDNMYTQLSGDEAGLVHLYKLDEGTGTTATDSAGTNDGTITGASWTDGESPLYRPATSGEPIPGISQGDDLSGKKLYGRQLLNDGAATMQSFTLQVSTAEEVVAARPWQTRARAAHTGVLGR